MKNWINLKKVFAFSSSVSENEPRYLYSNSWKANENSLQIFIRSIIYWALFSQTSLEKWNNQGVLRSSKFNTTVFDGPNECSINRKNIVLRTELK